MLRPVQRLQHKSIATQRDDDVRILHTHIPITTDKSSPRRLRHWGATGRKGNFQCHGKGFLSSSKSRDRNISPDKAPETR